MRWAINTLKNLTLNMKATPKEENGLKPFDCNFLCDISVIFQNLISPATYENERDENTHRHIHTYTQREREECWLWRQNLQNVFTKEIQRFILFCDLFPAANFQIIIGYFEVASFGSFVRFYGNWSLSVALLKEIKQWRTSWFDYRFTRLLNQEINKYKNK